MRLILQFDNVYIMEKQFWDETLYLHCCVQVKTSQLHKLNLFSRKPTLD